LPPPSRREEAKGAHLQQILAQLSDSERHPDHEVRILFYGQSITEQGWWTLVVDDLRKTYPHANLVIENRAIGGHDSTRLEKTAEADLYPFRPDLVIFHVYGDQYAYERIIRGIRERTTADVLMATDHVTDDAALTEASNSTWVTAEQWWDRVARHLPGFSGSSHWSAWWNYAFLPHLAEKYGVELADVHDRWKDYLRSSGLRPSDLLRDRVHLNERGQYVMAEIVKAYLRPDLRTGLAQADDRIRVFRIGSGLSVQGDAVTLPFVGNRADARFSVATQRPVGVQVDGRPATAQAGTHGFDRASAYPGSNWPALLKVGKGPTALVDETWTATLTRMSPDLKTFHFEVAGSRTGPDGSGVATQRFTSTSGRVVIEPSDWNLEYAQRELKGALPEVYRVTWHAVSRAVDAIPAGTTASVPLVDGLPNARHVLALSGVASAQPESVTVYRPPMDAGANACCRWN
jgi:hypothetical protein